VHGGDHRQTAEAAAPSGRKAGISKQGVRLEHLNWAEAEAFLRDCDLVVLPVGAASKEHGLHLPLNTDAVQAAYFRDRLLKVRRLASLPTVSYGYYPAFVDYPASVNLPLTVFRDMVIGICRSIARHVDRRFYVLNLGVSTNWALEPARLALAGEDVHMDYTDLTAAARAEVEALSEQPHGGHADEVETSRMMHIAPELVRIDRAQAELAGADGKGPLTRNPGVPGIYSPTGAWGDPTQADAAKGRRFCELLFETMLADVDRLRDPGFSPRPDRQQYL